MHFNLLLFAAVHLNNVSSACRTTFLYINDDQDLVR